jgi:hypothetical protein
LAGSNGAPTVAASGTGQQLMPRPVLPWFARRNVWQLQGDAGQLGIQDVGVHIGSVRPNECTKVRMDPDLRKHLGILKRSEDTLESKAFGEVHLTGDSILEA